MNRPLIRSFFLYPVTFLQRKWMPFNEHYEASSWIAFFGILFGVCLRYPSLSTSPEVYAEAGANFFYHAYHSPFSYNIFEFDYFNYLILLPRLISWFTVKCLHSIEYFPHIIQWSGLILIAYSYACFNLKIFRPLISSDLSRFFISLALGIGLLSDYELYTFVHFAYHCMFLMVLWMFVKQEGFSRFFYAMNFILLGLITLSKIYPLVFLPIYGVLWIRLFWISKKEGVVRSQWFYSTMCFLIVVQAVTTYLVTTYIFRVSKPLSETNFIQIPIDGFFYYLQSYLHFLVPPQFLMPYPMQVNRDVAQFPQMLWVNSLIMLGVILLFGMAFFQIKKYLNRTPAYFFLVCNLLAYISLCLTVHSTTVMGDWPPKGLDWRNLFFPTHNRWFYLSSTCIFWELWHFYSI